MASRSTEEAITPSVAKYIAWRSRGITCVEIGSGLSPIALATCSSTRGSIWAKVPTAPEIAQVATSWRASHEPLAGAGEFGIGVGELQPERHRLGMNAMRAADGRRHLVLEGALLQRRQHLVDIGYQEVRGTGQLHVETGVEHVGRGHALVHEARLGADDFRQMGQEGDDVVLGFALDLVDPRHVENDVAGLGPDRFRGLLRNDPQFRQRISRMRLDLEPDLEARLGLPDGGHFRAGIAGYHRRL